MLTAEAFLEELQQLILNRPKRPLTILRSQNCMYGSYVYDSKRLYYAFDVEDSQDCCYIYDTFTSRNCMDCDFTVDSELCYECVDTFKSFNSDYLRRCENMQDSAFCYRCDNGKYLFGCVGLRNRQYCIFNRQLTPELYEQWVTYYKSFPIQKVFAELQKLMLAFPLTQTHELHNTNCYYSHNVTFSKNCYMCFDARNNESSGYIYNAHGQKMCYDIVQCGPNELCFEVTDSETLFNCNYTFFSKDCIDSWYAIDCNGVKDSLGAVCVDNRQFIILNRQFSKEDYEQISRPLIEDLVSKNLGWGNLTF